MISDDRRQAVCTRVESSKKFGRSGPGWRHQLATGPPPPRELAKPYQAPNRPPVDFSTLAGVWHQLARDNCRLPQLATLLGLSVASLTVSKAGWSPERKAWSWPMYQPSGRIWGIRLRTMDGRKFAVTGSREGLFLTRGLDKDERLFVCEGPTDAAALYDLGSCAIGRPSNISGSHLVAEYCRRNRARYVVLVLDRDTPNSAAAANTARGAASLLDLLRPIVHTCWQVRSPFGKDIRDWLMKGGSAQSWRMVSESAKVLMRR